MERFLAHMNASKLKRIYSALTTQDLLTDIKCTNRPFQNVKNINDTMYLDLVVTDQYTVRTLVQSQYEYLLPGS